MKYKEEKIHMELWNEGEGCEESVYVDMTPEIDIHGGKFTSQEGYIKNNVPRNVRIFFSFNTLGIYNGKVLVDYSALQEAHDIYYELQKKTILLERKLFLEKEQYPTLRL